MRKAIWTMLTVAAVLVCAGLARAEEPKADPADNNGDGVEQRQQQREEALESAMSDRDFDKALSVLEETIGDKDVSDKEKSKARFRQFQIYALGKHDGAKACPIAKKLGETMKDDPKLLNYLAWTILDAPELKNRDLDVALAIAKQAAEVSRHEDAAILDTLARAHFEKGDIDKAIEFQTKALEKCPDDDLDSEEIKSQIEETLEKYKAEKEKSKPKK